MRSLASQFLEKKPRVRSLASRFLGGHFLCFCMCRNYADFLLRFICQTGPDLILLGVGVSLGSLLFLVGLGGLFHSFGSCPNRDDFLLQFISQSAPKRIFATLGSSGPSGWLSK